MNQSRVSRQLNKLESWGETSQSFGGFILSSPFAGGCIMLSSGVKSRHVTRNDYSADDG